MGARGVSPSAGIAIGPITLTAPVITTWVVMLVLVVVSWLATRRLSDDASPAQVVLEGIVSAIDDAIQGVLPGLSSRLLPFIGTLWIFIVAANLSGLIPGVDAPTAHLSTTTALAVLVFASVHWYGIRTEGFRAYMRHYLAPTPIMLPFHIMSEISRTIALAVRLFGNMMSLEMAALLILLVAGFLVPVPLLLLHIVEALIQAYIFGMLALIYIAGAIQSQQRHQLKEKD
jgi:F-type H+-transporting ATPase subunit a